MKICISIIISAITLMIPLIFYAYKEIGVIGTTLEERTKDRYYRSEAMATNEHFNRRIRAIEDGLSELRIDAGIKKNER